MELVETIACSFKVTKVHHQHKQNVNAIDFTPNGRLLISSGADDQIVVYDVEKNCEPIVVRSKKYGSDLVRFTHCPNAIIHSSTKGTNNIHYLSIYDNKYLRHYDGHEGKITGLCMSPLDDTFLSVGNDRTVRLWDLRMPFSVGQMRLLTGRRTVAAIDPRGEVFAVGVNSEHLKFYDFRSYTKGPLQTVMLPKVKQFDWTGLKYSANGKMILLNSNGSKIRLLESMNGKALHSFDGDQNEKGIPIEASFSPDSRFIFAGSTNGQVHCWSTETGYKVCILDGGHPGPTQCVQFNPRFMMLASTCSKVALWAPSLEYVLYS